MGLDVAGQGGAGRRGVEWGGEWRGMAGHACTTFTSNHITARPPHLSPTHPAMWCSQGNSASLQHH
ncbi:hypothetical protein E2C01_101783 [Portunus trituberculatus]|uniref:Uncharacterized protein n=1 Tax=Portunus trituberculatus TaxID=210409 RepID=A0A5B7KGL2_PORTR|nr:hypothetical protein [Portunus trituberculatus]